MKCSTLLFVFAALFFLNACGGSTPTTEDKKFSDEQIVAQEKLWDEMMVVHDAVMPKMGILNKVAKDLKALGENADLSEEIKQAIPPALQKLEESDKGMWNWMHGLEKLDALRDSISHDEILVNLGKQKAEIDKVKTTMLESIKEGRALLKMAEGAE